MRYSMNVPCYFLPLTRSSGRSPRGHAAVAPLVDQEVPAAATAEAAAATPTTVSGVASLPQ